MRPSQPKVRSITYGAAATRSFAVQIDLVTCFMPVASPESNGMAEAFVKSLERDDPRDKPAPDAITARLNALSRSVKKYL